MPRLAGLCLLLCLALPAAAAPGGRGDVIADFESGSVTLESYPGQDLDPGDWALITTGTHAGSAYSLRLFGNTWKTQAVTPRTVEAGTVWQVAVHVESTGEMQAFGVSDGTNELLYTLAGEQLPTGPQWWTVYQGAFPEDEWRLYLLPIGEDWPATHGYLPEITTLIYVNDRDAGGNAATRFDAVIDITADLPVAPTVEASYTLERLTRLDGNRYRAGIQFSSVVTDPDSPSHDYHWDFGDGATSSEAAPFHDFIVEADYPYAVGLIVTDPDGLTGGDTCQVAVEPGQAQGPITVNFVGDIMIARAYESNGGIIDTYGVDAIFAPTKPIFADAADLSVCNLECSFTDQGTPHPTKSVNFRARPENFVGVVNAGIDLCDLGNNHIIDYGEVGMLQTIQLCATAGIPYIGAGSDDRAALAPAFLSERGIRLGFLGLSNRTGRRWNYQPFLDAGASKPGFAYLMPKNLEESIAAARDEADVLIVQTHSGDEYLAAGAPDEDNPGGAKTLPADGFLAEPPVEAIAPALGDPDFRFRSEPLPTERALRRQAIELGADILINHHPHVLQGFESYQDKLIAHSLGNFIFDLYYPETMPTIVLTLEIEKTGITGYTFVPAWIDDYITQPATGMLGREIMDLLADYSRDMGALVAVDIYTNSARIYLDPAAAPSSVEMIQAQLPFRAEAGGALSRPLELAGGGLLSRIVDLSGDGLGAWEYRCGRELLWHGGFEDEGASFWDLTAPDEWLDASQAVAGQRSLAIRRSAGQAEAGSDQERHLPCDPNKEHSLLGWMRGDNAAAANVLARFYVDRNAGSPLSSEAIGPALTGDADWYLQWAELATPGEGDWFEVRCSLGAPASGSGQANFDGLKFIEWEAWQAGEPDVAIPHPHNLRYVQFRSANPAFTQAQLSYEETRYVEDLSGLPGEAVPAAPLLAQNYPNPFNPSTRLTLSLPAGAATAPVQLSIHDVQGRQLALLFSGRLAGGERLSLDWDGRDGEGRRLPSGVYFARARLGARSESRKLVLLK